MDSTTTEDQRIEELRETINHLFETGKYGQALGYIHELLKEFPNDWQGLMKLSRCHLMQDRLEEAEQVAKQLLEQDPRNEETLLLLSQIYRDQAKWNMSIAFLEQAIAENPEWDYLHFSMAQTLFNKQNLFLCVDGYFKRRINPDYLKNHQSAEVSLLKAMELRPGTMDHHALYGLVLDRLLRVDEAEVQFHKAITMEPMNPYGHACYAEFLYIQGKFKEFRDHANQALMLDPHHPMAESLTIKLDNYENSPAKILKELTATHQLRAELSPNPAYHYWRAALLMNEHGGSEPHRELRAYLRLVPDNQNAQLLYGKALFDSRRYLKAQRYFQTLSKLPTANRYAEEWLQKCFRVTFYKKYILYPAFFAIGKTLFHLFFSLFKLLGWPIYIYNRNKLLRGEAKKA
ncbi:tetratricopeptide repeat protein [Paenibacillus sp. CAU 1782]